MNFVFKKFKTFRTSFIETFFFNAAYEFDSFQTLGILKIIFHCQKNGTFQSYDTIFAAKWSSSGRLEVIM